MSDENTTNNYAIYNEFNLFNMVLSEKELNHTNLSLLTEKIIIHEEEYKKVSA